MSQEKSLFSYYNFTGREIEKYSNVSTILQSLTEEEIKKRVDQVKQLKLPKESKRLVSKYERVGRRSDFIWKWTYLLNSKLTLSSVPPKIKKEVLTTKLSTIIINALVDDIADEKKDKEMWMSSFKIFFDQKKDIKSLKKFTKEKADYLEVIKDLKEFLYNSVNQYPNYNRFEEVFNYDYRQFFNATLYGYLTNKNLEITNLEEERNYSSANMQIMVLLTIDLMASKSVKDVEIGATRELFWKIQRMGRIGNSLTTLEREIDEGDFSSEVFAYMLSEGVLSVNDLKPERKEFIINKIEKSNVKKSMLIEWNDIFESTKKYKEKISFFNVDEVLDGTKELLINHLCSKGFK